MEWCPERLLIICNMVSIMKTANIIITKTVSVENFNNSFIINGMVMKKSANY